MQSLGASDLALVRLVLPGFILLVVLFLAASSRASSRLLSVYDSTYLCFPALHMPHDFVSNTNTSHYRLSRLKQESESAKRIEILSPAMFWKVSTISTSVSGLPTDTYDFSSLATSSDGTALNMHPYLGL